MGRGRPPFFKILTGELDYDEGEVFIAPGKRLGLISQIPVYPAEYTVEDVLRTAFSRMERLKGEMDALAEKMAAGDSSAATLKRYGDLSLPGSRDWEAGTPIPPSARWQMALPSMTPCAAGFSLSFPAAKRPG